MQRESVADNQHRETDRREDKPSDPRSFEAAKFDPLPIRTVDKNLHPRNGTKPAGPWG